MFNYVYQCLLVFTYVYTTASVALIPIGLADHLAAPSVSCDTKLNCCLGSVAVLGLVPPPPLGGTCHLLTGDHRPANPNLCGEAHSCWVAMTVVVARYCCCSQLSFQRYWVQWVCASTN